MEEIVKDGIEICEDLCTCGAHLRLHTYTFGRQAGNPQPKFYVDCAACGKVAEWKCTSDEAIAAFDALPSEEATVSNRS